MDMDIYEQNYTIQSIETSQSLVRFYASDADEIQHAQILYELESSYNETFSLHPLTGELYLTKTVNNLKSIYEFHVYAYDRYRKTTIIDNNMKTKLFVKLNFQQLNEQTYQTIQTIFNQTIHFKKIISTYNISIYERRFFNFLNIHQPILTIDIQPNENFFEIFLLKNSSFNTMNLFINQQSIYLNKYLIEEYDLQLLICFHQRYQCQYQTYRLMPLMNFHLYQFHFQSIDIIYLDENLPVDSYITRIELIYRQIYEQQNIIINYKLLNDETYYQFYLDSKTGILRLAEHLKYRTYLLDIQAHIHIFNRYYSIETTIQIQVREINKYRPIFHNNTLINLFQLPYQFQAYDNDKNKQTNGRITYRLWNCINYSCPFQIDPNNGTLNLRMSTNLLYYNLQIIAFDWGQPISFQNHIDVHVDLSFIRKRNLTLNQSNSIIMTQLIDDK